MLNVQVLFSSVPHGMESRALRPDPWKQSLESGGEGKKTPNPTKYLQDSPCAAWNSELKSCPLLQWVTSE